VSFNFDDADVYSVIQTVFGDLLRVNYVVDPKVKGRVTFRSVAPVPRENILPVMEVILRLNGIGIVEEAGIFRIIQITDIAKEPAPILYGRDPEKISVTGKSLLQVVPVLNIQSSEIVKLIASFVSTNAVLIDVPRGNHIIIVDTDANVRRLLELVQIFDGDQFKKRKGEVYVYQVQNSKAKDVAALLQQIFLGGSQSSATSTGSLTPARVTTPSGPGSAAPSQTNVPQVPTIVGGGTGLVSDMTRIFSDEVINSVIVVGTPEDYALIKEAIQKIDVIRRQVVLEGVIAEVTLTDNLSLGLAYWLKVTFSGIGLKGQVGLNPGTIANKDEKFFGDGSGFGFIGVDDAGVVRAAISALASESKGKLLAAPHILVADNREARIQVGQQVPIVTSETFGSTTVAPQRTIQYKDIGIILKVKPQVNESGLVSLEIDQEVSSYSTQKLYVDSTEIIVNKAQATTTLVVADGQTIIIGGLIREDTNKAASGIPFLHRLPIIGYLFGEKSRDSTRKEMIILLTPHVIKTQEQARDVTKTYVDKFSEMGTVKKDDLTSGGINTNMPDIKNGK
jgi:general secretion pathway protein D